MYENDFDAFEIDINDIDDSIPDVSDSTPEELEDVEDALDVSADDDYYHAEHMSDEEVARIDEMCNESKKYSDVEPYRAFSSTDLPEIEDYALTDEEKFAAEIESMSLDELKAERDRLEELSKMDNLDFFPEFNRQLSTKPELDEVIANLPIEQLADLRDKLESRDAETLDFLGIDDDSEGNNELSLKLTKKL